MSSRIITEEQEKTPTDAQKSSEPVWCVIANVRETTPYGPGSQDELRGHRHFTPGTKVYVLPPSWDPALRQFKVLGLHRGSRRMICLVINAKYLTNWRVKPTYKRSVIAMIERESKTHWSQEAAEQFVAWELEIEKGNAA